MNKQNAVPSVILLSLNNEYPGKLSAVLVVSFKNCGLFSLSYWQKWVRVKLNFTNRVTKY